MYHTLLSSKQFCHYIYLYYVLRFVISSLFLSLLGGSSLSLKPVAACSLVRVVRDIHDYHFDFVLAIYIYIYIYI